MADLTLVADHLKGFYRLVGTEESDGELAIHGETLNEVAYLCLTRGCRRAQRAMLRYGFGGWRTKSSALVWVEDGFGSKRATLPTDFLRAVGDLHKSALVTGDGNHWGQQIDPRDDAQQGNFYYIRQDVWVTRGALLPSPLYLDYHYRHPEWNDAVVINFPLEARSLIVAEAANIAKEENWLPGGRDMKAAIDSALRLAQEEAREVARPTKQARRMRAPPRHANRW